MTIGNLVAVIMDTTSEEFDCDFPIILKDQITGELDNQTSSDIYICKFKSQLGLFHAIIVFGSEGLAPREVSAAA